jgi:hypothetical protein
MVKQKEQLTPGWGLADARHGIDRWYVIRRAFADEVERALKQLGESRELLSQMDQKLKF